MSIPPSKNPSADFAHCLSQLAQAPQYLLFEHQPNYRGKDDGAEPDWVLLRLEKRNDSFELGFVKLPCSQVDSETAPKVSHSQLSCYDFTERTLVMGEPWQLSRCRIPKPWGEEVWFTGMEARGVCGFVSGGGQSPVPIPWLLQLSPQLLGSAKTLNLLKILAPHNQPQFGELYFEMHRQKREVYVVSDIDKSAWPAGEGAMRYGFRADVVAAYPDFTQFKAAYLKAVQEYSHCRRVLDGEQQRLRAQAGLAENDVVSLEQAQQWQKLMPAPLLAQEAASRKAMDAFVDFMPLRLGDVVQVPNGFPHALMHGVRVVEFQTPVYERLILSFGQKVLTQDHWDTVEALSLLETNPKAEPCAGAARPIWVAEQEVAQIQSIVSFDDFEVWRLEFLVAGKLAWEHLSLTDSRYTLLMSLGQAVELEVAAKFEPLAREQASFLPPGCQSGVLGGAGDVLLLCQPR